MNGPYHSVYGVDQDSIPPRYQERDHTAAPPKAAPRTTVTRPVTVGALREARAVPTTTHRVPITQRIKEPEVPARNKLKKKTVAFGVTTNVSQTVEREKDPHPIDRPSSHPPLPRSVVPSTIPPSTTKMSLGRVGVAGDRTTYGAAAPSTTTRPLTGTTRQLAAAAAAAVVAPPPPVRDENRPPTRGESMSEERKDTIARLEARMAEMEKREREQEEKHKELQIHFDRLVKLVTTLTQRVAELEVDRGERKERSSDDDEGSRSRRRLYSPEDKRGGGEGRREQRQGRERGGERRDERGLLDNHDYLRALERQLVTNPMLRRTIDDAIEQDEYEREYGGEEYGRAVRRTTSPPNRRGGAMYDEYDDPPRATNGRLPASAPPTNRWKEETRSRPRMTPPAGGGGGRGMGGGTGGMTRKRSDITPSRRRVTERVTMTRVHHFDESSDSDGRGYAARYDMDDAPQPYPRTQYSEEIIDDIHSAVVPQNGGRRGYGQPTRRNQQHHEGAPVITEVSDTEDDRDRKRRLLRERMEAREGRK